MRRFITLFAAVALISILPASAAKNRKATPEEAARGVIERTLGYSPKQITLEVTGPMQDDSEYYTTEVKKGRLTIKGSSPVAICRGFYDYVTSNHYGMFTWTVNNITLPDELPDQPLKIVTTPFRHRQYMNVCTYGYTMPYWKWEQWERELDWMALHGIDMPLSPIGSEAIFARVWRKLGLTEEEIGEFVTGAAHFPWFRMGNMTTLDGNLSQAYYDETIALEHQLIDRMEELGMTPIYNAFAGFVPKGIKRLYPDIKLFDTGWRDRDPYYSQLLSPETELYQQISKLYIEEWEKEFGKGKYYLADSFNEMEVPFAKKGTQERFDQIAAFGKTLFNSIHEANPDAIWVLQGWMFGYQRHIWDPESIRALLSDVPDDKMLVLDLSVDFNYGIWESEYTWNYAPKLYGKKWLYSTVPNFGGRTIPAGDVDFYLNGHLRALTSPNKGNLFAYGTAPEGVENNEVIYEAITAAPWSQSYLDVKEWLKNYSITRYGACPEAMMTFWEKMLESSYGFCTSRAQYRVNKQPIYLLGGRYDTSKVHFEALEAYVAAAEELGENPEYLTDLALWAGIYAFGKADVLASEIHRCYLIGDKEQAARLEETFCEMLLRADRFLESNPVTRLERWIDFARQWGTTPEEADKYETNARRLVTTWGPGRYADGLNDYSCRIWSGLIRDYYLPRWQHFFDSKKAGEPFDFDGWEYKFAEDQRGVSPIEPYTDLVAEARKLVELGQGINEREEEVPGWTSFDMKDQKSHMIYMIKPEMYPTLKGIRFTHQRGEDSVLLKKLQINGAGVARIVKKDIDQVIGPENPVVEIPLEIKGDQTYQFIYLHIWLEETEKGGDSHVTLEYIR